MLNVKVHGSTIRKKTDKYGLFGCLEGESLFSLKTENDHLKLLLLKGFCYY